LKTKVLGKDTSSLKLKGIKLLEKIKRNKSDIKHGTDIWNVYDFLYLNNDLPSLKVLEIKIPSTSLFTIESKSMKLYLNGFYNQSFKSEKIVIQKIKNDLEGLLNTKIKLSIIKKFNQEPSSIDLNNYKNGKTKINTILKFNGFRSICPVTSQPDFANIYIYCDIPINTIWLIDYLIKSEHTTLAFYEMIQNSNTKFAGLDGNFYFLNNIIERDLQILRINNGEAKAILK